VCQRVYASCLRLIMCGEGGTGVRLISVEMCSLQCHMHASAMLAAKTTGLCT